MAAEEGRWECFEDVIDNDEENFHLDMYRAVETVSPMGESSEEFMPIYNTDQGMWLYPKENTTVEVEGNTYSVEVIFLLYGTVDCQLGDIIVRDGRVDRVYRVVSYMNPLSHIEAGCISIPNPGLEYQ